MGLAVSNEKYHRTINLENRIWSLGYDVVSVWECENPEPDTLLEKLSEFSSLFIIDSILNEQIPQHMTDYQERTGRSMIRGMKKLLRVTRATEILLCTLMLKWYLSHGLMVNAIHMYLKYMAEKPFSWFPEEVSSTR